MTCVFCVIAAEASPAAIVAEKRADAERVGQERKTR